jgi:signal transduction histidine kinase
MPSEEPNSSEGRPANDMLSLQREANEKLVLAGLRADEDAETALVAQRRAEADAGELRKRGEELDATAQFRERLIGIIGHDLRNPLNTIVVGSALLIARGRLTEEDAGLALRIVNSGQRMARMISQLVAFTRARLGGGFELTLAPTNLGDVCRDIADELRVSSPVEIRQTSEGRLDGNWDADRLAQALSNIAGNAVDYAAPSTPVLIHARGEVDAVVAEITNQGACIAAEVLPVIFEAFCRADRPARSNSEHLGLGLYIAHEIVKSHGGTLNVRSSDGSTTFTLRLPRLAIL